MPLGSHASSPNRWSRNSQSDARNRSVSSISCSVTGKSDGELMASLHRRHPEPDRGTCIPAGRGSTGSSCRSTMGPQPSTVSGGGGELSVGSIPTLPPERLHPTGLDPRYNGVPAVADSSAHIGGVVAPHQSGSPSSRLWTFVLHSPSSPCCRCVLVISVGPDLRKRRCQR